MDDPVTVLYQFAGDALERARAAHPEIGHVEIPPDEPVPDDVRGQVLLTSAWGVEHLDEVVEHGVEWIHAIGTGVDRFPLHAVGDRVLTCGRGASAWPIAEWSLAQLLAFEKRLPGTWCTEAPERWNFPPEGLGTLRGKTLAVVGLGGIGTEAARLAQAFGMRVRALRRSDKPSALPGVELATDLTDLLTDADHLLIAAPATNETLGMLDDAAFASMKAGVHIVNVARGSLIDQDALRRALDDGRVARASLDTVDPEPLPAGHWLYDHPKVFVSAHVSWSMPGAFDVLIDAWIANLNRYLAGKPLEGVVDVAAGY